MKITVLLFGNLRELTQASVINITISDPANLSDLLGDMCELYGRAFKEAVNSIQGLRILINGYDYQMIGGLETCLKDEDNVVLLPPIMGG